IEVIRIRTKLENLNIMMHVIYIYMHDKCQVIVLLSVRGCFPFVISCDKR
ncbi:hypothetical protein ACJX0J_026242, partial [Zea mays]